MKRSIWAGLCLGLAVLLQMSCASAESTIPAPPSGNLRYSITVTEFKNEAGWQGKWSVGDGMQTAMTNLLHESGWFIVLGDGEMRQAAMAEQDFAASGRTAQGKKTAKIGRMTPAQLLVRGSITHVQDDTGSGGGGLSFQGFSIGGSAGKAEMNVTIYLVDSETGQVKASTDVIGTSGKKGFTVGYHGGALGGLGGNLGGEMKDNVGKAMEDAVGQAVMFLIQQLEGIPWEGSVVMVKGGQVIINRGSREGVTEGREFKVGSVDVLVDPDTGEVLDSEMTQVGTIKVSRTKEKISYCAPISGAEGIQKGMSVFAMDR
ncbi:MAG: CsgG/HfaB family protein [Proteobacteria bacterium]|nr:CsgG/HfaB family protein [Pseudomonadota bacterium]MBU1233396.1 CsgG/HfaB family protein [Pseudomonadota bacterium]MBU1417271.1 CsgG/HfaB family protein [Pseudomonadota bacterium]MBU1453986.1 CsgG/HfaB family protein [Pseudomonadota bacterium]